MVDRVRLKMAGTKWWVLSRCDKASPRRAGGSAVVKDAPSTHPPTRAALRGATARSASSSTSPVCPPVSIAPWWTARLALR